jgi:diphthamide biosynthesis protein 3
MSIYEEVHLADMKFDDEQLTYYYTCPCGDEFEITLEELHDGEVEPLVSAAPPPDLTCSLLRYLFLQDVAPCPSCSLKIKVIFDEAELPPLPSEDDGAVLQVTTRPGRPPLSRTNWHDLPLTRGATPLKELEAPPGEARS